MGGGYLMAFPSVDKSAFWTYIIFNNIRPTGMSIKEGIPRIFFFLCALFFCLFLVTACKKGSAPLSAAAAASSTYSEIDTKAIADKTGVRFRVVKADSQGSDVRYKYFWICFADGTDRAGVEGVVKNVLDDLIAKYPAIYHSFTFHLFYQKDMKDTCENSHPFAEAAFLPGGDRAMVGRIPIDDYKDYRLSFSYAK